MDISKALRRREKVTHEGPQEMHRLQGQLVAIRNKILKEERASKDMERIAVEESLREVQLVKKEIGILEKYEKEFAKVRMYVGKYQKTKKEKEDIGEKIAAEITGIHHAFENLFGGIRIRGHCRKVIEAARNLEFMETLDTLSTQALVNQERKNTIMLEREEEDIEHKAEELSQAFSNLEKLTSKFETEAREVFDEGNTGRVHIALAYVEKIDMQTIQIHKAINALLDEVKRVHKRATEIKVNEDIEDTWKRHLRKLSTGRDD